MAQYAGFNQLGLGCVMHLAVLLYAVFTFFGSKVRNKLSSVIACELVMLLDQACDMQFQYKSFGTTDPTSVDNSSVQTL